MLCPKFAREGMASNFPKLPGYVPDHDCTKVDHKKVSHVKLEQIRNGNNRPVPAYKTGTMPKEEFKAPKDLKSMSLSQVQFPNHFGSAASVSALYMPSFAKLDKQVSDPFSFCCNRLRASVPLSSNLFIIGVAILCLL